jgi:mycoredoxin-dependent peroxiredoxin
VTAPAAGYPAADFELRDQHGALVRLSDHRAGPVVIVFFPFAFTGTCTGELRDLRGLAAEPDVTVLAISCDTMFTLRTFAEAEELSFPLLSDFWPHGAVASAYGAFDADRGCPLRASFVVDLDGTVRWRVVNTIAEARDVADYRRVLDELALERADVVSTHRGGLPPTP